MAYKLLCTDMDGTLLNPRKEISPRTLSAIREAFDRGLFVTFCTGRMPNALEHYRHAICGQVPLICGNGSVLADSVTGEIAADTPMDTESTLSLLHYGMETGIAVVIWHRRSLWFHGSAALRHFYENNVHHRAAPMSDFLANPVGADKLLFLGLPKKICRLEKEALERFAGINAFTSDRHTLEFVRTGVDKGNGLLQCARHLGIDPSEVIAVGDEMNDIPMLRAAGLGAAMGNARSEVKACAGLTVPSNSDDGVAWLIENYMLIN